MTVQLITASSPDDAIMKAKDACSAGEVMNLVLEYVLDLPFPKVGVTANHRADAIAWQSPDRDRTLPFTHGEYMNSKGDAVEYLADELIRKPSSNRACVSLVNMGDIIGSHDGALPSFLIVQVGFNGADRTELHLTAYFRALEVTGFLPINVAELALIAERVAERIASIRRVQTTIHAFRAHQNKQFRAHRRSAIDVLDPTEITALVRGNKRADLAEMLVEKSTPETIVEVSGLVHLRAEAADAGWTADLLTELDLCISSLSKLRTTREIGTHEPRIHDLQAEVTAHLIAASRLIARG